MADRLADPGAERPNGEPDYRIQFRDGRMGNQWSQPGSTVDWDSLQYPPHRPDINPLVGCVIVSSKKGVNLVFGRGIVAQLPELTGSGEFGNPDSEFLFGTIDKVFGDDLPPITIGEKWAPLDDSEDKIISVVEDTTKSYEVGAMPSDKYINATNPFDSATSYLEKAASEIAADRAG